MIKNFLQFSALALALVSTSALAELKVAVIDTQRALAASSEAQALLEQAQSELQKENEELEGLVAEVQALQEKLQKDGEVMSAEERRRATKEIEDKGAEAQFLNQRLQKEANDRRQELLQVMVPKVQAVLKDLIEIEGYDVIMERSSLGAMGYVNPKHDITRRVTEKLNEKR